MIVAGGVGQRFSVLSGVWIAPIGRLVLCFYFLFLLLSISYFLLFCSSHCESVSFVCCSSSPTVVFLAYIEYLCVSFSHPPLCVPE